MNYRHAFHAGNFADVLKHAVLCLCLERLNAKPAPYRVIDTHAGVGSYDLSGEEAERSPEWREAIGRLWVSGRGAPAEVIAALAPYMTQLHRLNPDGALRVYPGSPQLASMMMREQDALRLCELHPETCVRLREMIGRDRRVRIEERNGFEALAAYLPPPERRGLVLVDPPFEEASGGRKADFDRMIVSAKKAVRRWPGGIYLFWRPLKDIEAVEDFDDRMATALIEEMGIAPDKLLVVDLWVRAPGPGPLAGAGLLICNPPFGLEEKLRALLPWLAQVLDQTPEGADVSEAWWRLVSAAPEPNSG